MTQLTYSLNVYRKNCFKFCILEQIIATVSFICISNKRSLLKLHSTTAPTIRGWSACDEHIEYFTKDLEVRRDFANGASPVNRAHMKSP